MSSDLISKSKFLSYVLRHAPESIGITLDGAGWVEIDKLLAAAAGTKNALTRDELFEVVATSDKKRFAVSEDGLRIRASQGHSVDVELELPPSVPPEFLYHGTATRFVESIMREGLQKRGRNHVHLSTTRDTASAVGERHGKLAMLIIDAKRMHDDGHQFFVSANGVWLADSVPVEYITVELSD
jgi:putative RNA 2'-phosphotransferase